MRLSPTEIKKVKSPAPALVCLTAYTAPIARILDRHCDLLLVGDSVAMTLYGHDNTRAANLEMMSRHGQAVVRATSHACVIVDMPFGSYEQSPQVALTNAQRLMEETGAQGVKLEGGTDLAESIHLIVKHNIPVMGHIGLLPQQVTSPEGFRYKGRTQDEIKSLFQDIEAVTQAGAFSIVIEGVSEAVAASLSAQTPIPTIGIGASAACDGQILVSDDMLGLTYGHLPKFVKTYADLDNEINVAVGRFAEEVRTRHFPNPTYLYAAQTAQK
ncbi:MAG: 3-methyl-2-oxobutanoate hydroxymethyltransferase [Alphaproteobacteria bacterium]|nr:3-methyl-2-oxobutanoate hydroxymethyltransferase [Alphaproteobacteria bacterium]